ncbi:molecular chaperone TorD family protein [Burkholderia plantarii]|uniref:TorD/DmsD family molecular chaperone n=1 Tax=Burkholderia plantarii TaxID=41899 RepID=UPI00272C574C|nr:molecular chaperone TorD family protein [Burkholderia plantarii]WLE59863.1 molecular chaperone TorD family protein [Burkholderia plantarii]
MTSEADAFRAFVLAWVAGLLAAPPDAQAVARYREPEVAALFDALALELDCAPAIATMRTVLISDAAPRAVALDLSVAYTRLFEGVHGTVAVPLCESAYTGTRWVDQAAHEIAALLRRVGLNVRGGEPPDHLCVELALCACLLRDGAADELARLEARLCRWVPRFVAHCRAADPDGFHGAVASVLGALFAAPPARGSGPDGAAGHVGDVAQAGTRACRSFENGGHHHAEGT